MRFKNLIVGFLLFSALGCTPRAADKDPVLDSSTPDNLTITWSECGGDIGDHACDFTFKDQDGNNWTLYDHHGTVMVLDFSTMWCSYCRVAASEIQAVQDLYGSQDFLWVSIMIDDYSGDTVSVDEAKDWADTYGITSAPVLAGDRSIIDTTAENGYPVTSWPTFVILDRDLVIKYGLNGWSKEIITSWLLDALEE